LSLYTEKFESFIPSVINTWTTFSVSGTPYNIPASAVVEIVLCNNKNNIRTAGIRAVGSSLERKYPLQKSDPDNTGTFLRLHVQLNSSSEFQYWSEKNNGEIEIDIVGYWIDSTYVELADTFTANSFNSWVQEDLGGSIVDGTIVEIAVANGDVGDEWLGGVRKVGSIIDRTIDLMKSPHGNDTDFTYCTMHVEASGASGTIEVFAETSFVGFRTLGYWSTPPATYIELLTTLSDAAVDATWETINTNTEQNAVIEIACVNQNAGIAENIGARQVGSTNDRFLLVTKAKDGGESCLSYHVDTSGTNSSIQIYHGDVSDPHAFHMLGYWTQSKNESIDLIINGPQLISSETDLFICGHEIFNDNIDLFITAKGLDVSSIDLIITGHERTSDLKDTQDSFVYVLDRNNEKIFRMGKDIPDGESAAFRTDIEVLVTSITNDKGADVEVDGSKHIYWVDETLGILRSDIDGSNEIILIPLASGINKPRGIALDLINNNIYIAVDAGASSKIFSANLDGSNVQSIHDAFGKPVAIEYDCLANQVYFTEHDVDRISRISPNGSGFELVIDGVPVSTDPHGLSLDPADRTVYWIDKKLDRIIKVPMSMPPGATASNRTDTEILFSDIVGASRWMHLDIDTNRIYYTDESAKTVDCINIDGSNHTVLLSSGLVNPRGICVVPHLFPMPFGKLFTIGNELINESLNLFISSIDTVSDDLNIFIDANESVVDQLDLFTDGLDSETSNIDIIITGHIPSSGNLDVSVPNTKDILDSNITLYIGPLILQDLGLNLFINGKNNLNNNLDLVIAGHISISNDIDLFINGPGDIFEDIDLFIKSKNIISENLDIFISSKNILNENLNLIINSKDKDGIQLTLIIIGHDAPSGGINNLNTIGHIDIFEDIDLTISKTKDSDTNSLDLTIRGSIVQISDTTLVSVGKDLLNNNIDLFVVGHQPIVANLNLATTGHIITNNNLDLIIQPKDIISSSMTLMIGPIDHDDSGLELSIFGKTSNESDLDLIINGHLDASDDLSLSIPKTKDIFNNNLNLIIVSNNIVNNEISLIIFGNEIDINDLDLIVAGHINIDNNFELVIKDPKNIISSNIDLFISGKDNNNIDLDLAIIGRIPIENDIDLIIEPKNIISSSTTLIIGPVDIEDRGLSLFIRGKVLSESDLDLIINGDLIASDDLDLITISHASIENDISLIVIGNNVINNEMLLAIFGNAISTDDLDLVVVGHASDENDIDLVIEPKNIISSSTTLMIGPVDQKDDGLELFICGKASSESDLDLIADGHLTTSGDLNLNVSKTKDMSNTNLDLITVGNDLIDNEISLIIFGNEIDINDLDLVTTGHLNIDNSLELVIKDPKDLISSNINLFIDGKDNNNIDLDLIIIGHVSIENDIDLIIEPKNIVSSAIDLMLLSKDIISEDLDLTIGSLDANDLGLNLISLGHEPISSGITLKTSCCDRANNNIDLLINSKDTINSNITLIISPLELQDIGVDLLTIGHLDINADIDLFIGPKDDDDSGLLLFIHGKSFIESEISLMTDGHTPDDEGTSLFIIGHDINVNDIDLFTEGHAITSPPSVAIGVKQDSTIKSSPFDDTRFGLEETLVVGHESGISNRTLLVFDISGIPSGAIIQEARIEGLTLTPASGAQEFRSHPIKDDWVEDEVTWNERSSGVAWDTLGTNFVSGIFDSWTINSTSGSIKTDIITTNVIQNAVNSGLVEANILLKEHIEASVTTIISSQQNPSGGPILIIAFSTMQPDIDLFIGGIDNIDSELSLFIGGVDVIGSGLDLVTCGSGIIPISGDLPLCINGVVAKTDDPANPTCPPLDPTASIQISDELIGIYQSRIDALINQLGKNITLEFAKIRVPCPNCLFDTMRDRSTGIFRTGGPRPFARGRRCPWCKGNGFEESDNGKCIKALLKWNPKEASNYGIDITKHRGIVRIKTFLTEFDDLVRAETVIVNKDIQGVARFRVKLIKGPIPVGLREDRYCISFWELIDN